MLSETSYFTYRQQPTLNAESCFCLFVCLLLNVYNCNTGMLAKQYSEIHKNSYD